MMTIKEFAKLCSCNAQTLRYYDKIDLLKPVKVDPWSGYRYYTESQALDFVKIKNLQAADFTIDEIKILLTKTHEQVYEAFNIKIMEQKQKLERILQIQQTYLRERNAMENLIHGLTDFLVSQLKDFDVMSEFGLKPADGERIREDLRRYMEQWMLHAPVSEQEVRLMVNDEIISGAEQIAERISSLTDDNLSDTLVLGGADLSENDNFAPEQYETIWERHGWNHVYEFIDEIPSLTREREYCFFFRLNESSYHQHFAFPMFMLGAMIDKNGNSDVCMGCSIEKSEDAENHFALMRKR